MLHLPNRKRADPPQKIPAKKKKKFFSDKLAMATITGGVSFSFFQLHKLTVKNTPTGKKTKKIIIQNSSIQMWEGVQRAGPEMAQHGCKSENVLSKLAD